MIAAVVVAVLHRGCPVHLGDRVVPLDHPGGEHEPAGAHALTGHAAGSGYSGPGQAGCPGDVPVPGVPAAAVAAITGWETAEGPAANTWQISSAPASAVNPAYVMFKLTAAPGYEATFQPGYGFALNTSGTSTVVSYRGATWAARHPDGQHVHARQRARRVRRCLPHRVRPWSRIRRAPETVHVRPTDNRSAPPSALRRTAQASTGPAVAAPPPSPADALTDRTLASGTTARRARFRSPRRASGHRRGLTMTSLTSPSKAKSLSNKARSALVRPGCYRPSAQRPRLPSVRQSARWGRNHFSPRNAAAGHHTKALERRPWPWLSGLGG